MRKTYITKMPDQAGAFMEVSRIVASAGANITRVSYNKAVDTHTLFLDVSGTRRQLDVISDGLREIGYIHDGKDSARVMLLDFLLQNVPGAVLPVLELIDSYHFNISYISFHESDTDCQDFKMGLFIENPEAIRDFLEKGSALCEIRVIDYDESERVLDNTVFYMSFANRVAEKLQLSRRKANDLMAQSNRIMQMLDERSEPPYKTFDYIGRFADMLAQYRGEKYQPIISRLPMGYGFEIYCIQPPCGSNTYILRKGDQLLFVDSGFACYAREMYAIFCRLFPDFESMERQIVITHPDMDHCGLLGMFDDIYVSRTAWEHFRLENEGEVNFRERNPAHAPYCRISRILSRYIAPEMDHLRVIEGPEDDPNAPICFIGSFVFAGKHFDLYRGNGGHVGGEVVIVDEEEGMVFTGDIVVNIEGFTREQAAFNRLAPYLMTSVNMDSALAGVERRELLRRFPQEKYIYCCGHGAILDRRAERRVEVEEIRLDKENTAGMHEYQEKGPDSRQNGVYFRASND